MKRHLISFKNAFAGLAWAAKTQPNFRLHLVVTLLVCVLAYYLKINWSEFLIILVMITGVIVAELFNTSLEAATDAHKVIKKTVEEDRFIGIAKDVAAAAVLVTAIGAVIIGTIIFTPHLFNSVF